MGRYLTVIGILGGLVVALGSGGCNSTGERTSGQVRSDRQVARAVKKELASDPSFTFSGVEPMVYEGTVQLTGFVNSPAERERAAELAAQASGAKQVFNYLRLKLAPTGMSQVNTNAGAAPPQAPSGGSGEPWEQERDSSQGNRPQP